MADTDPVAAELAVIRADLDLASAQPMNATSRRIARHHTPRLLSAADKVLALHKPRQLYDLVESFSGKHLCAHDPDYDGDAHFEGDDGLWYCKDKPGVRVCGSCADESQGDLWAEWPCATYSAVLAELTGKGENGG